jgi:hypothetical protein
MDNRDDRQSIPPVRFRAVVEMSFPDADPWDPSDYDKLIEQWRRSLEDGPSFKCRDVVIREILTIGETDDYESWRNQDLSQARPGIRIKNSHKG